VGLALSAPLRSAVLIHDVVDDLQKPSTKLLGGVSLEFSKSLPRPIRAVMVLELIGDGESKKLLMRWAAGPVGALLTLEASAALKRLEAVWKANQSVPAWKHHFGSDRFVGSARGNCQ